MLWVLYFVLGPILLFKTPYFVLGHLLYSTSSALVRSPDFVTSSLYCPWSSTVSLTPTLSTNLWSVLDPLICSWPSVLTLVLSTVPGPYTVSDPLHCPWSPSFFLTLLFVPGLLHFPWMFVLGTRTSFYFSVSTGKLPTKRCPFACLYQFVYRPIYLQAYYLDAKTLY